MYVMIQERMDFLQKIITGVLVDKLKIQNNKYVFASW